MGTNEDADELSSSSVVVAMVMAAPSSVSPKMSTTSFSPSLKRALPKSKIVAVEMSSLVVGPSVPPPLPSSVSRALDSLTTSLVATSEAVVGLSAPSIEKKLRGVKAISLFGD